MPKVTSLSEQLKRLQVPQTNVLNSINDNRRVSFLYDPKEAANLDSEAVFSIATNGLEQLKAIDHETFESFELTLFNSTSLSFERGIQTKQVNEQLNKEIRRFLIHLSPYFMLKPAHKTLEWLVYRYQVHIYNINDLFMCILPYHETNFFVRALQLIDFKSSDAKLWSWLEENQKHGVQVASSSLATHVFSDLSFFNFLIDYLNEAISIFADDDSLQSETQKKHWNKNLNFTLSFMCKTLLQSVKNLSDCSRGKNSNKIEESFFAQLLPLLFAGFKSTFVPYKQTSYLVASFLFEKFRFTTEAVNKTLFALTKGLSLLRDSDLSAEGLDCLKSAILSICLITQSQYEPSNSSLMNKNFLKKLVKNFSQPKMLAMLLSTIDDLNQNYCVDKFLKCFTSRLLFELLEEDAKTNLNLTIDLDSNEADVDEIRQNDSNGFYKCLSGLCSLLNLNRMPSLVESLIEQLFSKSVISQTAMSNLLIDYHLIDLIKKFETKYPIQFDSVLNKFLLNLDKPTRSKFLNFLSTKFKSLTLKSVFKYHEIESDLSLLLSLNHQNENVRASGMAHLLKLVSSDPKLEPEFVKSQIEVKFRGESSSKVYREILNFGALLLNYFPLETLVNNEEFLLKIFTNRIYPRTLDQDEINEETKQNLVDMASQWSTCRSILIDLYFNEMFKLYPEKNFFNLFLNVSANLFQLNCPKLIDDIKTTQYYKKLQSQVQAEPSVTPITKKFYSVTSSITVTKLYPDHDELVNENFETFLQLSVKHLLVSKDNNCVNQPECFDQLSCSLTSGTKTGLSLVDFYAFEISTRLATQCLFFQNSQYFLNIALNLLKYFTKFINVKKSKAEVLNSEPKSKHVTLVEYLKVISKSSIKNFTTLALMYSQLFKSISTQISNFVNTNSKIEIENVFVRLYLHLCEELESRASIFSPIVDKFITSSCFSSHISHTPTHTPTKSTNGTSQMPTTGSFYQFVFKFLLTESPCRVQTVTLLNQHLNDFINFSKKIDHKLLDSYVLVLTWTLTSQDPRLRQKTLLLLDELCKGLDESCAWKSWLKKLLKHRQEIEIDGADYVRTKSLNKIFASDCQFVDLVHKNLELSVNKLKNTHLFAQFSSARDSESDSECHILVKFKHMILDLCKNVKEDHKVKLLNVLFQILVQLLTESDALVCSKDADLVENNKKIINVVSSEFILTAKSANFFNQNDKCFDYLIGYLNNKNLDASAGFVRCFKMVLVSKLGQHVEFFKLLDAKKQFEFMSCLFDSWLFNSSKPVEESLKTGQEIQQNTEYLEQIKMSLINFDLSANHLVYLLNTKANLEIQKSEVTTTKEMKKQLHSDNVNAKQINWRSLRLVLELVQSNLVKKENSMEVDGQEASDDFIALIPYLFLVLESIETTFLIEQSHDKHEDFLYFEISSLNSLLQIYKLNKLENRSKLDQSKFNIELLMQILQTKRDTEDRLNVQQHILILLSEIAAIFPEKVLEHVLIMFVFVGNKLARKDDSYSFQIISLIIKSILPAIVDSINSAPQPQETLTGANRLVSTVNVLKRHEKQLPYVSSLVCKILQSFVVALPHIPAHRKAIIFDQLMSIIGLNDYLWITIVQAIDHYLVQSSDLMDFSQNLEKFQTKQQQLLANRSLSSDEVSKNEKKLRDTLKSCLNSMISLHVQFEPMQLVQSSVFLVAFLTKYLTSLFTLATHLATNSKDERKKIYSHLACQLDNYNLLQMKYLAYNLLTFVSDLLVSDTLVSKLADFYESKTFDQHLHSALFEKLLENILLLILKLSQVVGNFEQAAKSQTLLQDVKKFHKALMNKSYDLLERLINLLDSKKFCQVIKNLIKHESMQIRRRSLSLLNNKLRKNEPSNEETTLMITMIDDLLSSIQLTKAEQISSIDVEINNQTVLFSIKLLCKRIGEQNPLAFAKVLKFLSDNLIDLKLYINDHLIQNSNLLSSVLLCIGEVCLKLKSNSLPYLNQIMTFTLAILDLVQSKICPIDQDLVDDYNWKVCAKSPKSENKFKHYELLAISCVTCVLKIVQNMSNFLSPFLKKVVHLSCSLSHLVRLGVSESGSSPANIELKLTQLRLALTKQVPLRLLAPILAEQSAGLMDSKDGEHKMKIKHVEFYMQIARMAIQNSNHEDLISNLKLLRSMFMSLFELRSASIRLCRGSKVSKKKQSLEAFLSQEISRYEEFVIGAFVELTFKLSEDLFKPIFFKVYEWATCNNPPKDRLITFYRITWRLSDKLKNLFVIFAPQFTQNAADLLNQLNCSKVEEKFFDQVKEKENILLNGIVDTLANVFLNDSQRSYVNKERFNVVMEPLVDQIENEIEFDEYQGYILKHLGPCIANLAYCVVNDEGLLRKFNYQLLLKTKHNSVQVRLAALDVLNMFCKRVGDVYNAFLSETVPFLAELMEDPVEEVEDKVQFVIKELEDILGESLQSHFG
ncbi:HEAT repeat-containing 1 [Brachionus plicatilis]|uniref:HEAT repeat-containing protein 1 n=1 Tax=Brachionus plicatilis TaxID=10195 RepID=A0A3M7RZZ8_BRAPC|nr:HEAT repeat-containing 1 [Brachionus plicatilis]